MKWLRQRYRRYPAMAALLLFFLTFAVFLAGGWYTFEVMKTSKEHDLEQKLLALGRTFISTSLNGKTFLLLESRATAEQFLEDPLEELDVMRNALLDLLNAGALRSAMIISNDGRVLLDARGNFSSGEEYPLLELDASERGKALSGESAVSPLYYVDDKPYKRCYVPIRNTGNEVTAILRIEASADWFDELANVKNAMYWMGGVCLLLLSLLAFLFYKIMKALIKTEETLAFTDRMNSMGAMAAGFAHEIRNPLSIIRMTTESMLDELHTDSEHRLFLESIIEETERLNKLMTQFLEFSKPASTVKGAIKCDAVKLASSLHTMFEKNLKKKGIELEIEKVNEIPPVAMQEKPLRQALLNLLINARDVMSHGGKILIRMEYKKNLVTIEVIDNGPGIAEEKLSRIFDPFYTTKEKGTGLGLFVSRFLVEKVKGGLELENNSSGGVRAILTIPAA